MDVKCERCNTEYEFDDALVSGRGTTVKCTNCGHKFKIRRDGGDFSEDFWNVTTGDGRTLVFTSLRELQRAIQGAVVGRDDRLSRGGLPPKPIGLIPELAPFFDPREATAARTSARGAITQTGLGPEASTGTAPSAEQGPARQVTIAEFPAPPPPEMRSLKGTLLGTGPMTAAPAFAPSAPPPPRAPSAAPAVKAPSVPPPPMSKAPSVPPPPRRAPSVPPPTERTGPPAGAEPASSEARQRMPSVPPPPPRVAPAPASPPAPAPEPAPTPAPAPAPAPPAAVERTTPVPPARAAAAADVDTAPTSLPEGVPSRRRKSVGGFVVAAVVVGCLVVIGAAWARKNLGATLNPKPPAAQPTVDPRVGELLSTGEKALAAGDLELAKESFDKASALADKDARVLVAVAELAAVRADRPWLKARLVGDGDSDERRVTRDTLDDLAARARRAADDAVAVAPDDVGALRAKVDAARISGDRESARALVGRITAAAGTRAVDPETAYVLAALDLAEEAPLWPTVIERLRMAASAETGPGRARAALVYALARSGDSAGAKAEVERLDAMPKAHPLLPLLRGFAERAALAADAGAGVEDAGAPETEAAAATKHRSKGSGEGSLDPRELVLQGERARARGEYDKARGLFDAAVARNPNDSEALAGLAAIAHAQHDVSGARAAYKRVLAINPNYLPAAVGLADLEWESGDHANAARLYKDITDRFPDGTFPARVRQRAEGGP